MIYPVIPRGGTGSRLWPLSRALLPKQFLPLASNSEHRFPAAEQLRDIGEDDIVRFVDDYKRA